MSVETDGRPRTATSADGTRIAYVSLGAGPGVIIFGGTLSSAAEYMPLASELADEFEVHVVNRRGRPGSGEMRPGHGLGEECSDLIAVAASTGARAVLGHSFGGLVALEAARKCQAFDRIVAYEPGVPLRGELRLDWLPRYEQLLGLGKRREAFAWMVTRNGFAPRLVSALPAPALANLMRLGLRGERWATLDRLLEANVIEHQILVEIDAPDASRFAEVSTPTLLLGGALSPPALAAALLPELAAAIPLASARLLSGLGHTAPQGNPGKVAVAARAHLRCAAPN